MPQHVSTGQIAIVDVNDGLSATLTNNSVVLPADAAGTVSSYTGADTTFTIFEAGKDTSPLWGFYVSALGSGITYRDVNDTANRSDVGPTNGVLDTNYLRVTSLTTGVSYIDITATKAGQQNIVRRFSVARANAGSPGAAGRRGTLTVTRAISGGAWLDSEATTAIAGVGGGAPINGDIATLFRASPVFSETRVFNGTAWVSLAAYIAGSQIIEGSVNASKLIAGTIQAVHIAGDTIEGRNIKGLTIEGNNIKALTLTGNHLETGSIKAAQIGAGEIVATKLAIGNTDNIIPDGDIQDRVWWTGDRAGTSLQAQNGAWTFRNAVRFDVGFNADYVTPFFPVEVGATYKISVGLYASVDFAGRFNPTIHMPATAVYSLKSGSNWPTEPNGANATHGITAGEYLSEHSFTFTNPTSVNNNSNRQWQFRFNGAITAGYVEFMVKIVRVGDGTLIANGAITTNHLTVNTLNGDRILADSLDANKIKANSILAGNITVSGSGTLSSAFTSSTWTGTTGRPTTLAGLNSAEGTKLTGIAAGATVGAPVGTLVAGTAAATVASNAATGAQDPATRINGASTTINPGKILIQGGTTLDSWRDQTEIRGGAIKANSISASKLDINSRGINIEGLDFQIGYDRGSLELTWNSGWLQWLNDSGAAQAVNIAAGSTYGVSKRCFVYWNQGETFFRVHTRAEDIVADQNAVMIAVYMGGSTYSAHYGGTVIDGDRIRTGTIDANRLNVTSLSAISANIGLIRTAPTGQRSELDNNGLRVYDANGTLRVRLGVW
jgi:hypothetical protein